MEVEAYLRRKFEGLLADVQIVEKEDLDMVGARAYSQFALFR